MTLFQPCKFCAHDVYGSNENISILGALNGVNFWEPFLINGDKYYVDVNTNFGGSCTYNRTENILIIAFRGTVFNTLQDLFNDIDLSDSYSPLQYEASRQFLQHVKEECKKQNLPDNISFVLTGHSLGGGLAQLIAVETGHITLTFNAVGMQQVANNLDVLNFASYAPGLHANITNYAISSDIVANAFDTIGNQIFALGASKPSDPEKWCTYFLEAHRCILESFYDEGKFVIREQTAEGKFFKNARERYPVILNSAEAFINIACSLSKNLHEGFGDFPLESLENFFKPKKVGSTST